LHFQLDVFFCFFRVFCFCCDLLIVFHSAIHFFLFSISLSVFPVFPSVFCFLFLCMVVAYHHRAPLAGQNTLQNFFSLGDAIV